MTSSRSVMQEVAPHLAELSSSVLFGDIWERPGLSKPESTEGGRRVSVLKRQEGAPVLLR